jgi:hypothetical protein
LAEASAFEDNSATPIEAELVDMLSHGAGGAAEPLANLGRRHPPSHQLLQFTILRE